MVSQALPPGTRMAGFTLGTPLGQGGFGITYRAQSDDGARLFAIKEYFPSDFARRTEQGYVEPNPTGDAPRLFELGRKAFLEEAYILRDLPRQSGLVRVRGAFEKQGTAYCVMDFIKGDPLDRIVPRIVNARGHVPEVLLTELISTLCLALNAVHGAGFIHRDLKPGNVMINSAGLPVLIDFGAARARDGGKAMASMLSRKYAALEQFPSTAKLSLRGIKEGPWTDLYALSVMLYEIVTQDAPPTAETRFEEILAGRPDPYIPVQAALRRNRIGQSYSGILLDLIDRGCAIMPADRPQNAVEYRLRISSLLRSSEVEQHPFQENKHIPATVVRAKPKAQLNDRQKTMLMLGVIAMVAVLAVVFGAIS